MKITDVTLTQLHGHWSGPVYPPGMRQSQPLDVYPEFNQRPADNGYKTGDPIKGLYLEIHTDEGISGQFGSLEEWQTFHIYRTLRPFLIGRDPLANEVLLDQMIRMDRHGRTGLFMTAVSAVDIALWDLKGKAWNQPIYRLLGGPTRPSVPAYASMLGFSTEPEPAATVALEYKAKGFTAQKWFFRYGPGDGAEGLAKNLAMAHAVREALGANYMLMFDCFMGWDVTYAIEMVRGLAPLKPAWMEEPVPPQRVAELRKIREAAPVPLATGEHIYTRWETKDLLVSQAVDILQNDPDWSGGITEQMKICALGSAFETPVIAHGHSLLPALHVAGAQSPATVPYVEYLIRHKEAKQFFHKPIYRPENGAVTLPTLPGLGFVLDEEKIEARKSVTY